MHCRWLYRAEVAAARLEHLSKHVVDVPGQRVLQSRLQDDVCFRERKPRNESRENEKENLNTFYSAKHGNSKDWLGRVPSMRRISGHVNPCALIVQEHK